MNNVSRYTAKVWEEEGLCFITACIVEVVFKADLSSLRVRFFSITAARACAPSSHTKLQPSLAYTANVAGNKT